MGREFEEYGTKLRTGNDRGDDTPEAELTNGILDQLAKFERAKIAERTRRGKLRKAREGKLLRNSRAHYGFKYDQTGEGYVVDEAEMSVVRRICQLVAEGETLHGVKRTLELEGANGTKIAAWYGRWRKSAAKGAVTPGETRNPWRTVSSRRVYENPWISVREDRVVRPGGEPGIYGVVHYKNVAVGVLPVEDAHTYLVGQYRYPLGQYSWEIPEGGCPEGEEPLRAAQRELREETGLEARRWEMLGEAYLSNSVADEYAVWFLATELTPGEPRPDAEEILELRRVPLRQALEMALNGQITDALSHLALTSYALKHPIGA